MIVPAHVPVHVDITTSMVAVVTVLAALVFTLATLARPSRATVTWGAAFGLGVLGAYLWLAGNQTSDPLMRAAASGLLLCFEPLVWIGLRMHLRRRVVWWPVAVYLAIVPSLLVLTAKTPVYLLTFHTVFVVSGVFAAFVGYELLRRQPGPRDILLPLALASCAFIVVAVTAAVAAAMNQGVSTDEQLSTLRGMNAVGTLVLSTCAAFTLVLMVRAEATPPSAIEAAIERARWRLQKAGAQNEQVWSLLDVRLDDPADLREASTGSTFAMIADRFHDDIQDALPAAADAIRIDDTRAIVIIRGSEEAVRFHMRDILTRISTIERGDPIDGIRASASIGWATVASTGYDYDELAAAAGAAAVRARAAGGDRWKLSTSSDAPAAEVEAPTSVPPAGRTTLER
ncbi:hypothetical protein [Microbacterium sp. LWH11-1.2]|uniref:hypothetical protein n=1 Tax=Microbacterium sp. LWH11-1.2 TaxID=3135258 RepID=UPI003139D759